MSVERASWLGAGAHVSLLLLCSAFSAVKFIPSQSSLEFYLVGRMLFNDELITKKS